MAVLASSAGNTRGLIEAGSTLCPRSSMPTSSAGNTRGLIEANVLYVILWVAPFKSSAGNTRGLIEAGPSWYPHIGGGASSAGNTRGLIEALRVRQQTQHYQQVFRGEYPRPH